MGLIGELDHLLKLEGRYYKLIRYKLEGAIKSLEGFREKGMKVIERHRLRSMHDEYNYINYVDKIVMVALEILKEEFNLLKEVQKRHKKEEKDLETALKEKAIEGIVNFYNEFLSEIGKETKKVMDSARNLNKLTKELERIKRAADVLFGNMKFKTWQMARLSMFITLVCSVAGVITLSQWGIPIWFVPAGVAAYTGLFERVSIYPSATDLYGDLRIKARRR